MEKVSKVECESSVTKDVNKEAQSLDHPHKSPLLQDLVTEDLESTPSSEMITQGTTTAQTHAKKMTEINVEKEIIQRLKKEAGGYNYIPLSTGKLSDIWWRPIRAEFFERVRGTGMPMCVIFTQIFIDSPSAYYDCDHYIAFKGDAEEVLKISFLLHTYVKEINGTERLEYDQWKSIMMKGMDYEKFGSDAEFAVKVFTCVMRTVNEKLPEWCRVFFMKKPSTRYIFPPEANVQRNLNSIACTASTTGFKFEYRSRLLMCIPTVFKDDEPPLGQPLF